jgi:hypothetical protein
LVAHACNPNYSGSWLRSGGSWFKTRLG